MPPLLRRYFADKNGHVVLWQRPNAPLIVWLVFTSFAAILGSGPLHGVCSLVARVSITIWAILEILRGVSPFRRTLGGVIMLLTAWSILR